MWKIYLLETVIVLTVSILWVIGIEKMSCEYPNYKGEDFLSSDLDTDEDDFTK